MKKSDYISPKIILVLVQVDESIATGSYPNTVNVTTEGGGVRIADYDFYEEGNKDFNVNF